MERCGGRLIQRLPEFIAESPNSGIRVGIVLFLQKEDIWGDAGVTLPSVYAAFRTLTCHAGVIITATGGERDSDISDFTKKVKSIDGNTGVQLTFLDTEYEI